jgi:hypothetical protein
MRAAWTRAAVTLGISLSTSIGLVACHGGDGDGNDTPPDTTAPSVTVGAVAAPASRVVTLTASANDDVAVTQVQFFVDGVAVGTDTTAPFAVDWDSATVADGAHAVTAEASDAASNTTTSAEVAVEVQNQRTYTVNLTEREEVPATASDATGTATFMINVGTGAVSGTLQVAGIDATAAHIHGAHAGANGPVLIGLEADGADPDMFAVPANALLTPIQVDRLLEGGLYVNAHTARFPGGEIRGQILPEGFQIVFARMQGVEENPPVETNASGTGAFTIDTQNDRAWIHLTLAGLDDATAAHVHRGFAGTNGDIDIGLQQDPANPAHWFSDAVAVDADGAADLARGELYLNAHSTDHPNGEVRGQLLPDGIELIAGALEPRQQVPRVDSPASGQFAVTLDRSNGDFVLNANTSGLADASAAHIHDGHAGTNGEIVVELEQDMNDAGRWAAAGTFDEALLDALDAGRLYVNVHSPANPGGEIRGQLAPAGVAVLFDAVDGSQEVPPVTTPANALAATTLVDGTSTFTVHVRSTGIDDATDAHVHRGFAGEAGPVVIPLEQDLEDLGHWFVATVSLEPDQRADFDAGRWYLNLHTLDNLAGEIRGQLVPPGIEVTFAELSGDAVVPPVATAATGRIATTVDRVNRMLSARLDTSGLVNATAASIRMGNATQNGAEIVALTQDGSDPDRWFVDAFALDASTFDAYAKGNLYVTVATLANPDGAIRAQIVPDSAPPPDMTDPTVTVSAPGGELSGTVQVSATAADENGIAEVRFFADGALIGTDATAPYQIAWDTTDVADGTVTLTAEAEDPSGNVATSAPLNVTVMNAAPPPPTVTLAQIQTDVFTPICSGCHTGPTSNFLPGGMDLTNTTASFNALVGVPSLEVPSLDRVEPGNPDASYLIDKLEGTQTFGDRMPQGGPFLSQATIDEIRSWIAAGAPGP